MVVYKPLAIADSSYCALTTIPLESGFEAHVLISSQQGWWGLLSKMRLTNRKKLSGCGLLYAHYTRSRERVKMEHHISCVIRSPKTVVHMIILLWPVRPWSWHDWAMYLASFLVWCDTFAPRRDAYLQNIWEKTTWQRLGSAVSLHLSALCRCRSIPISFPSIRSACA